MGTAKGAAPAELDAVGVTAPVGGPCNFPYLPSIQRAVHRNEMMPPVSRSHDMLPGVSVITRSRCENGLF